MCMCVGLRALGERGFGICGVCGLEATSHLRLQVHDLLAHQWNGGAGLLPLHCLQLQRGGGHCLQVLPHPGRRGVGLSDALPRPLTRGLLLVLKGKKRKRFCLVDVFSLLKLPEYEAVVVTGFLHVFQNDCAACMRTGMVDGLIHTVYLYIV